MTTSSANNSVFRGFFEKQKLTGPNFIDWYRQLRIVPSIKDKLNYLEQPIPPAPVATAGQHVAPEILAAHNAWIKGSKEIDGLMLMTMKPEIQRNLESLYAYEMLRELKTLFAQQAEQELLQTTRDFHSCRQEEGQSVSLYVLKMKGSIDNLERLGHPVTLGLGVSMILIGLRKKYDSFVQNYNMHNMGKTVNKLHAMIKLHEQTLPKNNAPALHAIRADKVQKASGAGGSGIFVIELNTILNRSWIYDIGCGTHICNITQDLRASRKLKPGAFSLYVGNGQREAVEAIGIFNLCLPSGLEIVLNNCHYAPSITRGVISVFRFRYGYVYLLKHKHEVFETFKVFQKKAENQLGKTIKSLRSDRRGEYMSQEFLDHLKDHGIITHRTPPYTLQHNVSTNFNPSVCKFEFMVTVHWMTTSSTNNSVFRGFFEKQKLTGPNFIDWYQQLRIVLSIEDKLNYLEQPIPPAPVAHAGQHVALEIHAAHNAWIKGSKEINYNMHSMGKTVNELHAMLKLHEQTLPKATLMLLMLFELVRSRKVISTRNHNPKRLLGDRIMGKGKNKQAYAPKPKIPPPPKRENPAKDFVCHECGEIGHWKRNCPQYLAELMKKKKNTTSGPGGSGIFIIELNTILNRSWIYDTGCGTHICNTTQGLRASRKLKPRALSLYVGNGQREAVEVTGAFYLCLPSGLEIVLNNCHYAPSITRGVISVSRLYEDGFVNRFVDNTIQVSRNNVVYFIAIPRDGIFEIDLSNSLTNESSIYAVSNKRAKLDLDSALLRHCRL
nr:zinc finger, CCHC-type [Tanacetum cinerariifolium]